MFEILGHLPYILSKKIKFLDITILILSIWSDMLAHANRLDPDLMLHSKASDPGLHCNSSISFKQINRQSKMDI